MQGQSPHSTTLLRQPLLLLPIIAQTPQTEETALLLLRFVLTGTRISTRHDNRARASSLVDIKPVTPQSPAATARSSMLGRRRESHLGLLGNGLHIRTFLALTWTGGDGSGGRRAVEFPQAFRFALDICLFAAGCALFFFLAIACRLYLYINNEACSRGSCRPVTLVPTKFQHCPFFFCPSADHPPVRVSQCSPLTFHPGPERVQMSASS